MTQQQLDDLIVLSAPLLDNPLPWNQLTPDQQSAFKILMPQPKEGFTEDQRYWINKWWLPITEQQIENINDLVPANTKFVGREDINGDLFLNVDLLSDSLNNGRLSSILFILETLPLTYKLEEEWPEIEPEL